MTPRVVVVSPEELAALVEAAVAAALARLPSPAAGLEDKVQPLFVSEREAVKRYRIGRRELRRLILDGRVPSTTRRVKGGNESFFIRTDDADRVLGNRTNF